jgi:hypothetical protein
MKLTNESVAALKLDGKKDLIVFDSGAGSTPGFAYRLRAGANGKTLASWVLQYRKAGASRRYKLGPAGPGALSAEKARALAKEALGRIWAGQDPSADRAARRDADKLTFARAVADFLESKQRHLRPNTFAETKRYLTGGYFKALHGMPLDTITRQDVAFRHRARERRRDGRPSTSEIVGVLRRGHAGRSSRSQPDHWRSQAGCQSTARARALGSGACGYLERLPR